jgi:hypothetical protein
MRVTPKRPEIRSLWLITVRIVIFFSIGIIFLSLTRTATSGSIDAQTFAKVSILTHPKKNTTNTKAKFTFSSTQTGIFKCKIDSDSYNNCKSPVQYSGLSAGRHTFTVKSTDSSGLKDVKPGVYSWTITTDSNPGTTQLLEDDYLLFMP